MHRTIIGTLYFVYWFFFFIRNTNCHRYLIDGWITISERNPDLGLMYQKEIEGKISGVLNWPIRYKIAKFDNY